MELIFDLFIGGYYYNKLINKQNKIFYFLFLRKFMIFFALIALDEFNNFGLFSLIAFIISGLSFFEIL